MKLSDFCLSNCRPYGTMILFTPYYLTIAPTGLNMIKKTSISLEEAQVW